MRLWTVALALGLAAPLMAQDAAPPTSYADLAQLPIPVTAGNVTDRPYRVIAPISAKIRKATVFSKAVSEKKVYRELWERGKKLGADAVIRASYGESRIGFTSWGDRRITGYAVKFLTEAEAAPPPGP